MELQYDLPTAIAVVSSLVASISGLFVSLSIRRQNMAEAVKRQKEAVSEEGRARELEDRITQSVLLRANKEIEALQAQAELVKLKLVNQDAIIAQLRHTNEQQAREIILLKASDAEKTNTISRLEAIILSLRSNRQGS